MRDNQYKLEEQKLLKKDIEKKIEQIDSAITSLSSARTPNVVQISNYNRQRLAEVAKLAPVDAEIARLTVNIERQVAALRAIDV